MLITQYMNKILDFSELILKHCSELLFTVCFLMLSSTSSPYFVQHLNILFMIQKKTLSNHIITIALNIFWKDFVWSIFCTKILCDWFIILVVHFLTLDGRTQNFASFFSATVSSLGASLVNLKYQLTSIIWK